jgi:hypothetical protein
MAELKVMAWVARINTLEDSRLNSHASTDLVDDELLEFDRGGNSSQQFELFWKCERLSVGVPFSPDYLVHNSPYKVRLQAMMIQVAMIMAPIGSNFVPIYRLSAMNICTNPHFDSQTK